jgi:hypothetical protein
LRRRAGGRKSVGVGVVDEVVADEHDDADEFEDELMHMEEEDEVEDEDENEGSRLDGRPASRS